MSTCETVIANAIDVNKCCGKEENFDIDGYTCVKAPGNASDWFPYKLVPEQVDIIPRYGAREHCKHNISRSVSWSENDTQEEYKLSKKLCLKEYYYKSDKPTLRAFIHPSEYCMDKTVGTNRYIARFCPCHELICVRKCCLPGFYLSLDQNVCEQHDDNDHDYSLRFHDTNFRELKHRPPHYVLHAFPTCASLGNKPLNREKKEYKFFILANGSAAIMSKPQEVISLNSHQYCVDHVEMKNQDTKMPNLILCKDENLTSKGDTVFSTLSEIILIILSLWLCK
ncbi:hypothetical protein L9F63_006036 [Diploptera punctata]|uniref:Methuselah N-terminal domain-containing protein n=1 Tax=Diploptera punctata TaxID=6984 RepID=A0AAD7ZBC8_DIPPU|nr:hypothetical protein L9F63_006036 [Diploptera punctata]